MGNDKNGRFCRRCSANHPYGISVIVNGTFVHLKLGQTLHQVLRTPFFMKCRCGDLAQKHDVADDNLPDLPDLVHKHGKCIEVFIHDASLLTDCRYRRSIAADL